MENQYISPPHHVYSTRPSLGFPLGTALLLIIIFSLSGIFSCCYHWDKIKSLRRSISGGGDLEAGEIESPSKAKTTYPVSKQNENQSMPVLMPGDRIPKFIALPCPCEPFRPEKVTVEVQMPPQAPLPPPRVYDSIARFGVYYHS